MTRSNASCVVEKVVLDALAIAPEADLDLRYTIRRARAGHVVIRHDAVGCPVACAAYCAYTVPQLVVYVVPTARRCGHGRAIVETLLARVRPTVYRGTESAAIFWAKFGERVG